MVATDDDEAFSRLLAVLMLSSELECDVVIEADNDDAMCVRLFGCIYTLRVCVCIAYPNSIILL